MKLYFENATEQDIPVILSQAKELVDTYEDVDTIDYDRVMAWMERKITKNISQYRCVVTDGKRCAYWRLCEDGELDDLYVLPSFRGQGIGSHILDICVQESKNPLFLYVFTRNQRAIAFYERFGFAIREMVGKTRCVMERKG